MKRLGLVITVLTMAALLTTSLAFAEDETSALSFGGDTFIAGSQITHSANGTDDLFMAGESLQSLADISGSLHAAGRTVNLQGSVDRDVYAMGMDVSLRGKVGGDATLAGYDVLLDSELAGDLRASGSTVTVNGPVSGYALLAGENVTLNSRIVGDVSLAAENISFGSGAKIDGQLVLYEETPGELKVPENVITEDRITRKSQEDLEEYGEGDRFGDKEGEFFNWRNALLAFFSGVILVAAIAALIAGIAPQHLANMRKAILLRPFRTLGLGFITQAAVIGSAVLFAMTVIGLLFAPASVLLAFILGFLGYVIGAYAFGVGFMLVLGRNEPTTFQQRALAAATGALVVALLGLIPFLGWLFVLAIVLTGIGAITTRMFRPMFFAEQQD